VFIDKLLITRHIISEMNDRSKIEAKIIEFVSFCVEMCAQKHNVSGAVVMEQFVECGVADYLIENYEALHTQGPGYILPLIDEQLRKS
jgi:hypothetical protein